MKAIVRETNGKLSLRVKVLGCRFHESTGYPDTTLNRLLLKNTSQTIRQELQHGTFEYKSHFPHSRNASIVNALQSRFLSPGWRGLPTCEAYYNHQFHKCSYLIPKKMRKLIMGCIGHLKVDEVTGFHLVKLIETLGTVYDITEQNIQNTIELVLDLLDSAAVCYVFPRPFRFIPTNVDPNDIILTHKNILRIADHIPVKYRDYFLIRYYLGLSFSELITLKWSDYDLHASTFRLKTRHVYVAPYARRLLYQQMKKTGNFKHVFSGMDGKLLKLNIAWLHKICWPNACEDAGFKRQGIHALKQASVVYLFESGLSVGQICLQTGLHHRPSIDKVLTLHVLGGQGMTP